MIDDGGGAGAGGIAGCRNRAALAVHPELGPFAFQIEVLVVALHVEGHHVAGLGGDVAGVDQAGAVYADFGAIAETQRLCAAAGGVAAVKHRSKAGADLDIGDAIAPETIDHAAQDLALLVAAIAMAGGAAGLAAGE